MQQISRYLLALTLLLSLAACSTISGWFESDDKDANAPAKLADINQTVNIKELWSEGVGKGQGDGFYRIRPVVQGDNIFVAAANGKVAALNRMSGKTVWETDLETTISGGVGVFGDALYLGSGDGVVLKLNANTGERAWSTPVRGEILSAPQSNGKVVAVQTHDGKLQGLDSDSGAVLWTYDSNVPALTVRGTSTPIMQNNVIYAGFANGRVLAFDAQTGGVVWEVRVAISQGRSEIERMVDIGGSMELTGNELYAASYQGNLAAIDVQNGRKLWQQKAGSFSGVSQGLGNVYVANEDGTINAYMRTGEGLRWTQDALAHRELSRPTPVGSYVAVADFEGYVHVLSQVDGEIVGRVRADKDGARADMVSDGDILYVYGNGGDLIAYEITAENK
jgi:outer membrane protein assembly factor BamB